MVSLRSPGFDPFFQKWSANLLDVPGFRRSRIELVFLGVSEWLFGALLFLGFWNKKLGILGALGSCVTFIMTITIIPFMPDGWNVAAGGFPAMQGNVAFLMKDLVLFAVSVYLLKQDVARASLSPESARAYSDHKKQNPA